LKIEFLYALRDESDIYTFTIVFSMLSSFSVNCDKIVTALAQPEILIVMGLKLKNLGTLVW